MRSVWLRPVSRVVGILWIVTVTVAGAALLAVGSARAGAETPGRVVEALADDGVFVGFGRSDVDEDSLVAAVAEARSADLDLVAVVPRDPQPSPKAFARRVQELAEVDAVIVFPEEGPLELYVMEDFSAARARAVDMARRFVDPARATVAVATELTTERVAERPPIVDRIIDALVLFCAAIGVVVAIELGVDRLRRGSVSAS